MELISYCVCLLLLLCGCLPGIWRAKQLVRGELHSFVCGHLVGEFFLQMLFCAGVVIYLVSAHVHGTAEVITSTVLALTGLYLVVGLFFVTGENQDNEEPKNPNHARLGWPLMAFQLARLTIMLVLITISLS